MMMLWPNLTRAGWRAGPEGGAGARLVDAGEDVLACDAVVCKLEPGSSNMDRIFVLPVSKTTPRTG